MKYTKGILIRLLKDRRLDYLQNTNYIDDNLNDVRLQINETIDYMEDQGLYEYESKYIDRIMDGVKRVHSHVRKVYAPAMAAADSDGYIEAAFDFDIDKEI